MKSTFLALGLCCGFILAGCATNGPIQGGLFTSVYGPVAATPYPITANPKVGTGSTACILGLFSVGDASIHTACAQAGITKIQHIDYQTTTVLFGLFSSYKIIVYGE